MTALGAGTLAATINATLADVLERDPTVVLLGEDIGRLGGVFQVTRGLQERFGPQRVRDSVLAESTIVGQAVGMALSGLAPVCEIQFDGFVYPAVNQLVTQAARIADRWGGRVRPRIVVRIPSGGGARVVEHHGESGEGLFAQVPGLCVACPSSGEDYDAVLRHALTLGGPVVVHEPTRLYWRRPRPARSDSVRPAGAMSARVLRRGTDVTVVTYGAIVHDVLAAADALAGSVDVEVVDLRWVAPLDRATVLASVARTGRLLIVHEASGYLGVGAEVAAVVAEEGFGLLRAPVRRLTGPHRPRPPADLGPAQAIDIEKIKEHMLVMTT